MANNDGWEDVPAPVAAKTQDGWEDVPHGDNPAYAGNRAADPQFQAMSPLQKVGDVAKHVLQGSPKGTYVEGEAPMAIPAGAIPGMAKLAQFLGKNALTRIGTQAAVGAGKAAVNDENVGTGALKGAAWGAGGEAVSGLIGAAGRLGKVANTALSFHSGEPTLYDKAKEFVTEGPFSKALPAVERMKETAQNVVDELRGGDQQQALADTLKNATIKVRPASIMGHDPELDQEIKSAMSQQSQYGNKDVLEVPAADANKWRGRLDGIANWKTKGVQSLLSPEVKESGERAAAAANELRSSLHDVPGASHEFMEYADNLNMANELERQKDPVNYLTGVTPSRTNAVARMSKASGVPLQEDVSVARSARRIANHPSSFKSLLLEPTGQAASGAMGNLGNSDASRGIQGSILYNQLFGQGTGNGTQRK